MTRLQKAISNTPYTAFDFCFDLKGSMTNGRLPRIERQEKLPVVLSRQEMKRLLKAPEYLSGYYMTAVFAALRYVPCKSNRCSIYVANCNTSSSLQLTIAS